MSELPFAAVAGTRTVRVNSAVDPSVITAFAHVMGPVPAQDRPPLPVIETKVIRPEWIDRRVADQQGANRSGATPRLAAVL